LRHVLNIAERNKPYVGGKTVHHVPNESLRSIKDWQQIVTEWAVSKGFSWVKEDVDTMLLRIHSEVSEASEAIRDNNVEGFVEELADIFIRLVNLCEVWEINLEEEVIKKHNKNLNRSHLHGRKNK
jgi:NTP pyrophosphatase (non-canonical NTP hydrolase)